MALGGRDIGLPNTAICLSRLRKISLIRHSFNGRSPIAILPGDSSNSQILVLRRTDITYLEEVEVGLFIGFVYHTEFYVTELFWNSKGYILRNKIFPPILKRICANSGTHRETKSECLGANLSSSSPVSIIHDFLQLGLALLSAFQVRVEESNRSSNSVKGKAIGLGRELQRGKVELCQLITCWKGRL